jgi:hypothetical protein
MNLPAGLAPAAGPDGGNVTPQGANSVTLPFVIDTATKPAGRQPARPPVVPDSVVPDSSEPDAVVGADSTANPKPEATTRREPPTIDLTPLVPQGVPTGPPITINNPLRELLPPDLDLQNPLVPQVLPAPLVAILTAAAPSTPMLGIGAPPADLAPMGIDIMQAPAPQQPPPTPSPRVEPLAPAPPPPASAMPENEPLAFRAGYSNYLRNASLTQIIAIAVPGAAAILLLSLGGGFIGYRQARAGHVIRAEGITRFLR